jgi:hypothetical protein
MAELSPETEVSQPTEVEQWNARVKSLVMKIATGWVGCLVAVIFFGALVQFQWDEGRGALFLLLFALTWLAAALAMFGQVRIVLDKGREAEAPQQDLLWVVATTGACMVIVMIISVVVFFWQSPGAATMFLMLHGLLLVCLSYGLLWIVMDMWPSKPAEGPRWYKAALDGIRVTVYGGYAGVVTILTVDVVLYLMENPVHGFWLGIIRNHDHILGFWFGLIFGLGWTVGMVVMAYLFNHVATTTGNGSDESASRGWLPLSTAWGAYALLVAMLAMGMRWFFWQGPGIATGFLVMFGGLMLLVMFGAQYVLRIVVSKL